MSEREFDFYLAALASLLRLSPAQREQIADELRDHLEERLEELTRLGCSREEAIRDALEEFGDAAGLAAHFSRIAQQKQRRFVMRCTFATVAVAAGVLVVGSFMLPEARVQGPGRLVAQQPLPNLQPQKSESAGPNAPANAEVEAKLATRIPKLELADIPLADAIEFLSEKIGVDILFDKQFFDNSGLTLDIPIRLHIRHTAVSARTALELILEQVAADTAGYTIRDGVIYLTEKYTVDEMQVYNCRDLLLGDAAAAVGAFGGEGGPGAGPGPGPIGGAARGFGGGVPVGPGGYGVGMGGMGVDYSRSALVHVIVTTIHPETWVAEMGGQGSIAEFNGLLIVKHSQTVHREIRQLLTMMRAAAAEQPGGK